MATQKLLSSKQKTWQGSSHDTIQAHWQHLRWFIYQFVVSTLISCTGVMVMVSWVDTWGGMDLVTMDTAVILDLCPDFWLTSKYKGCLNFSSNSFKLRISVLLTQYLKTHTWAFRFVQNWGFFFFPYTIRVYFSTIKDI